MKAYRNNPYPLSLRREERGRLNLQTAYRVPLSLQRLRILLGNGGCLPEHIMLFRIKPQLPLNAIELSQ